MYEYHSETHQQTRTYVRTHHVLVRQHLLQHLQGVFQTFFSVLVCLSRLNCWAVWAFLRGEGGHSAIYRHRQTCFPVYITAVWTRQTTTYWWLLGGGASCSRRAIVLLYWHTTLSRNIVTVFYYEAREREARAFCSWFQGRKADVQSDSQARRRLYQCRLVSLHTRTNSNCDLTKKIPANWNSARKHFIEGSNNNSVVYQVGSDYAPGSFTAYYLY